MTASLSILNKKGAVIETVVHRAARLVPVVYKKDRLNASSRVNNHSHKAFGVVLDSNAVHGRGFVTRRTTGQDCQAVMAHLKAIIDKRQEIVNG